MINRLKHPLYPALAVVAALLTLLGCDEAKLPPLPDAATAKADAVGETVDTAGQPAFVDTGAPRFDPKRQPRSPEQLAKTQQDIKNGVMFNHLEVLPDVKLASQRVSDEVDLSPTGMTLPLKGNEAMLELKPGTVLAGGATQNGRRRGGKGDNAFGFLRKVKTVQKVGDSVVVETEIAQINEVFAGAVNMAADASLAADINVDGIDVREYFPDLHKDFGKLDRKRGGWEQKSGPWGIDKEWALWGFKVGGEHSFPIDIEQTVDGVPVTLAGEFKVKAEAGVEAGIGVGFDIDTPAPNFWDSSINYFRLYAYGKLWAEAGVWLQAKAEVQSQLEAKIEEVLETLQLDNPLKPQIPDEFTLGEFGPKKGPTIIAGPVVIPTTYLIEMLAQCETKVSSSVTATANAGLKGDVKFGIEYTKKAGFQPIKVMEFYKWKEFKITDGALTATVQCWVGPRMHWLIGGVVGPYIDGRAGLRGTMKYDATCPKPNTLELKSKPAANMQLLIDIGLKVMLGGTIKIGKFYDYSPNVTLYEGWWEMFKKTFWDLPTPPTWCPSDCENGKQDNAESGVDCGPGCSGCPLGSKCTSNWDCKKGNTCVAGACSTLDMEDPCNDAKQGPGELDVDCGGPCGKCKAGQKCTGNGDCSSGLCQETTGKCSTWDCQNGMFDPGGEVDVDCGGNCKGAPTNKKCGIGKMCGFDDDCQSNACFWTGNNGDPNVKTFCIPESCKSFKDNTPGSETGNNCGGPCVDLVKVAPSTCWKGRCGLDIFRCPLGEACLTGNDCVSGNCIAETGKCGGDKCSDGSKDGDETDVDCGGSCKNKCQHQKLCTGDSDCAAGLVCTNWSKWLNGPGDVKKCMKIDENGKKDLGESDIDCGAKVDSKCTGGQVCVSDGDCAGEGKGELACLKTPFKGQLCVSKGDCKDGQKNGLETDIDCGKGCSAKCQEGKNCLQDGDCAANFCEIKEIEVLPTGLGVPKKGICKGMCSNGAWDEGKGEADVDCGGSCSTKCVTGAHCSKDDHCWSNFCWKGSYSPQYWKCADSTCEDKYTGPFETDIDCGGPCKTCQMGQKCKKPSDCFSNECEDGKCLPAVCENWKLDEGEPSIDCGGTCPDKCAETKACFVDSDCQKGQCLKGICKFDPCQNSKKDAAESDVDCGDVKYQGAGWKCLKCEAGKACKYGADCESGLCSTGGKCVADACSDGIWSSGEGGVDCGGACPNKCAGSAACIANSDCATGFCATVKKCGSGYCMQPAQCQEPSCDDLAKNGQESDVDCGGGCGGTCSVGKKCADGADCATGLCTDGKCQPKLCENAKLDAGEADIDCGGACKACVDGKKCKAGSDCENGMCLASGVCGYDACLNLKKDAGEADYDCGGVCDAKCAIGKACKVGKDCQSGFCDGAICVASACEDKQLSPGEAGIDCGSACATKCAAGAVCKLPGDCSSTYCDGSVCVETACQDKKLSKGETDVDCGGSCSAKCALKAGCKAGSDCQSNVCNGAVCAAGSCWDLKKTDGEGDVDCGGTCAAKCSTGAKCGGDGDCSSGICSAKGTCVTSHCDDGKLSGDETALDCGGSCKTKCLAAVACKLDGDCFSGACAVTAKVCVSSACYDQAQNKGETDVDCGGPCKPCGVGQKCAQESDCNSEACQGQPADGEKCDLCAPTNTCSSGKCALVKVKCPDDGDACTLEKCAAADGSCSTAPNNCDDGNVCSDDSCNAGSGCVQTANSAKCTDSNPCTVNEVCSNKTCSTSPWGCNDNNVCTADSCDPVKGCANPVIANKCEDNNVCTSDSCHATNGCSNQVIANKCDDGNVCTNDSCHPTTGCGHSNNTAPCADNDQCTINETCSNGACSKQNKVCNDGQECTEDQCSASAGCVHPAKPAGSSCSAGVCKGTTCCQSSGSANFNYNGSQGGPDGSPQQWNVPACATWVYVKARGANGSDNPYNYGNQGGRGHTVWGYMSGLENKTLVIKVGGKGNALGGQYYGQGAIPGYNGGGGDFASASGFFPTGSRGGGGMTSVHVNGESDYNPVLIAGGGGASSSSTSVSGRTGGDGGSPSGQSGQGAQNTYGSGAYGPYNPGSGNYHAVYGLVGAGDYFQGGKAFGFAGVGGGGGGGGFTGGGGGTTSCDKGPPATCPGATGGGGGGGLSYFGNNMQKTGAQIADTNWNGSYHGQVIITWTAGPSVP